MMPVPSIWKLGLSGYNCLAQNLTACDPTGLYSMFQTPVLIPITFQEMQTIVL